MEMTLPQLMTYPPLVESERVLGWRMQLAMHHNPYLDRQGAQRLWSTLDGIAASLPSGTGAAAPRAGTKRGLDLKKLEKVMGQVKREFVSMDEFRRQSEVRAAKRREAAEAMRRRGGVAVDGAR
jgi:hypothetical protein